MLTQNRLRGLLDYDPETGILKWKMNRYSGQYSSVIAAAAGDIAGTVYSNGYRYISIDGKRYFAHRLAWLYVYGYFPEHGIDHRNRRPDDNWISNLREATQQCNIRNTGNRKDNTSGVKGVYWDEERSLWLSQITVNQKRKHLGRYEDFNDAACARLAAEQCLGWSGCDSSSPAFCYVREMLASACKGK